MNPKSKPPFLLYKIGYCQNHKVFIECSKELEIKPHLNHLDKIIFFPKFLLEKYYFKKVIGAGGFGVVFEVIDKINNTSYAIKIIKRSDAENEFRIVQNLSHSNIINYIQGFVCEKEDKIALVMELADYSLNTFVTNSKLSALDILKLFKEICLGTAYLHEQKIIHKDLNPSNILIKNNTAKIADFGISRQVQNLGTNAHSLLFQGTIGYMAPEYIYGLDYNASVDIFSLGKVLEFVVLKSKIADVDKHLFQRIIENCTSLESQKRLSLDKIFHEIEAVTIKIKQIKHSPSFQGLAGKNNQFNKNENFQVKPSIQQSLNLNLPSQNVFEEKKKESPKKEKKEYSIKNTHKKLKNTPLNLHAINPSSIEDIAYFQGYSLLVIPNINVLRFDPAPEWKFFLNVFPSLYEIPMRFVEDSIEYDQSIFNGINDDQAKQLIDLMSLNNWLNYEDLKNFRIFLMSSNSITEKTIEHLTMKIKEIKFRKLINLELGIHMDNLKPQDMQLLWKTIPIEKCQLQVLSIFLKSKHILPLISNLKSFFSQKLDSFLPDFVIFLKNHKNLRSLTIFFAKISKTENFQDFLDFLKDAYLNQLNNLSLGFHTVPIIECYPPGKWFLPFLKSVIIEQKYFLTNFSFHFMTQGFLDSILEFFEKNLSENVILNNFFLGLSGKTQREIISDEWINNIKKQLPNCSKISAHLDLSLEK